MTWMIFKRITTVLQNFLIWTQLPSLHLLQIMTVQLTTYSRYRWSQHCNKIILNGWTAAGNLYNALATLQVWVTWVSMYSRSRLSAVHQTQPHFYSPWIQEQYPPSRLTAYGQHSRDSAEAIQVSDNVALRLLEVTHHERNLQHFSGMDWSVKITYGRHLAWMHQ